MPVLVIWLWRAVVCTEDWVDFVVKMGVFCTFACLIVWTWMEYYIHRFKLHNELHLDPDAPADG